MDPRYVHLALALEARFEGGVPLTYWTHESVSVSVGFPYGRLLARIHEFIGPEPNEWMQKARVEIADAVMLFGLCDIEPPDLLDSRGRPLYMGQAMVADVRRGSDRLVLADLPLHDPKDIARHVARCAEFRNHPAKDPDTTPPAMPMAATYATVIAASDQKVVEPLAVLVSLSV